MWAYYIAPDGTAFLQTWGVCVPDREAVLRQSGGILNNPVVDRVVDCHDAAIAGRCSRGFKSLKIFSASGEESALSDLGVHSTPSSAFRILGASPKFKIVDFYG